MDVTERLLDTKVVVFLEILRFVVGFLLVWCNEIFDSLEKVLRKRIIRLKKCRAVLVYFNLWF